MSAVEISDAVIEALGELALTLAEDALIAEFPFLALPLINQLFKLILDSYGEKVIKAMEESASIGIIEFGDQLKNEAAKAAALDLYKVENDPSSTPEKLEEAKGVFKAKYARLIRFGLFS